MAFWIELHCDKKIDGSNRYGEPACYSHQADGPGVLTYNTNVQVVAALRALRKDALRLGWKRDGQIWICPNCWEAE